MLRIMKRNQFTIELCVVSLVFLVSIYEIKIFVINLQLHFHSMESVRSDFRQLDFTILEGSVYVS